MHAKRLVPGGVLVPFYGVKHERARLGRVQNFEIVAMWVLWQRNELANERVVNVLHAVFDHLGEAVQVVTEARLVRDVSGRLRLSEPILRRSLGHDQCLVGAPECRLHRASSSRLVWLDLWVFLFHH